uniref:Protein MAIN-LIKE 1-like n=1 Tax=Cicer arietinum TaxID=3827 RepID=A0A1S2XFB1_CICAR|nr:protein MAIN-LIKE 1-like [Cicer arietinum]
MDILVVRLIVLSLGHSAIMWRFDSGMTCYEMIDKRIISAFVEWWLRDINSFHLPIGEMTITLDDVSSLLHIPITGAFFSVNVFNKDDGADILTEFLGVSHDVAYAEFNVTRTTTVRYSWLLEVYYQHCRDQHWQMVARIFLLFLVGCTLFSDKSAYAVSVAYLECFRDLNSCERYAWGATALAYLYDNLRKAIMHQTRTVSGHLTLLQAWVYEHFPILCRDYCRLYSSYVEDYPRALKWKLKRDKSLVLPFRKALDEIGIDEVYWTPYEEHRLRRPFEEVFLFRGWIRWAPNMYAHMPDIILRQYVDAGTVVQGHVVCSNDYIDWFRMISHPYIICREPLHEEPTVHAADAEPTDHAYDDVTHAADDVDPADDTIHIMIILKVYPIHHHEKLI